MPKSEDVQLLQGTLNVLVLKTLSWGPRHGYAIARWIHEMSGDDLIVEDRALYLALHRLEERGWVSSEWGISENNRRARFYALTDDGMKQLKQESAQWSRYANAVTRVLEASV
jgi:PadR family transcriptional regulator, regulatory protein PadR